LLQFLRAVGELWKITAVITLNILWPIILQEGRNRTPYFINQYS
jgi:hypothetical protein